MHKWHIKSQGAMEFIILAGFLLFMFTAILGVVTINTTQLHKKRDIIIGEDLVTKVQKEINLAARVLDGYSREFTLPQKLGNKDYSIVIVGNELVVSTSEQTFSRRIPLVKGNVTTGPNTIRKNETIYIS